MVVRNTTVISKNEYNDVRIEYEKCVKESVITTINNVLDEVCNLYNSQKIK